MDGFLLIDKPVGWTSFDIVAKTRGVVRRQTGTKKTKVGHAGTLDPMASGLLIVLVGSYCKQAQQWLDQPKAYDGALHLGATSDTDDTEGQITPQAALQQPDEATVKTVCQSFIGDYEQLPPAYSAKKVNGVRAYHLARSGKSVKLSPKRVTIHDLEVRQYGYPILQIATTVSSGTYVRALARDIGEKLTTGAYLSALRRTQIGDFDVVDAINIEEVSDSTDLAQLIRQKAIDKT